VTFIYGFLSVWNALYRVPDATANVESSRKRRRTAAAAAVVMIK
jgi:hypothetical protein